MKAIAAIFWIFIGLFTATLMGCAPVAAPSTTAAPITGTTSVPSAMLTPRPTGPTVESSNPTPTPIPGEAITPYAPNATLDPARFSTTLTAMAANPTRTPTGLAAGPTPRPSGMDLSSLAYVRRMGRLSLTEGWVLTDNLGECGADLRCRARLIQTEGVIPTDRLLWTEDAGATWSDITPAGLSNCPPPDTCTITARPVFFDSSSVRIVLIRGQELQPPTALSFMYSEDGGRTWGLSSIDEFEHGRFCPGYGCLSGVDLEFSDRRHGWLSASASLGMGTQALYLYRTRDGGESWTPLLKTSTGDAGGPGWTPTPIVHRLDFIDASTGWAVSGWRWDSGTLLTTRDGASSWIPVTLDVPQMYTQVDRDHYDPVFFSRDFGVMPVRFHQGEDGDTLLGFFTTSDGGRTWSLTARLENPDLEELNGLLALPWSAVDETTWFVAVSQSRQYMTHDSGQNWTSFAAQGLGPFELVEVQFVSETEGWGLAKSCVRGVGCANSLFATLDGGRNWIPIHLAP